MDEGVSIIPYDSRYKNDVKDIFNQTAFMGEDISIFFGNKRFLADVATLYYLFYEPFSTFLAYDKKSDKVVGYIMGCIDTRRYHLIMNSAGIPPIALSFLLSGTIFQPKSLIYILKLIRCTLRGEIYPPVDLSHYPAHFHINVLKEYRSVGIGGRLMSTCLDYMKSQSVNGVHLHTNSYNKATLAFYKKFGFEVSGMRRSHIYDSIIKEPLYLLTLVKAL